MGRQIGKVQAPKEVTRETISRWEQTRPALKALNDATLDKPRGWSITKAEAERIAGGPVEFRKIAQHWRDSLLWVRGITVEWRHADKSYVLIEVDSHLSKRHQRVLASSERRHRSEWQRLAVMRDQDMTDHQKRLRAFAMQSHSDTAGKLAAQRDHYAIAQTSPETLPRIQ